MVIDPYRGSRAPPQVFVWDVVSGTVWDLEIGGATAASPRATDAADDFEGGVSPLCAATDQQVTWYGPSPPPALLHATALPPFSYPPPRLPCAPRPCALARP